MIPMVGDTVWFWYDEHTYRAAIVTGVIADQDRSSAILNLMVLTDVCTPHVGAERALENGPRAGRWSPKGSPS